MKRRFPTILLLLFLMKALPSLSQSPSNQLGKEGINLAYLEHLVKIKIDSVRASKGLAPLVNDSALFLAAKHHSDYMLTNHRLTHNEHEFSDFSTPQLRALEYGATKNYIVGENVLKSPYNSPISEKKKVYDGASYGGLATSMVMGWVHSPGHYRNIVTPGYEVTGVAVSYDPEKQELYACQLFAEVKYQYQFSEVKAMFPYSSYVPDQPRSDFDGIESGLTKHAHEWGLKHDQLKDCAQCEELVKRPPQLTLRIDNGRFVLRIENSEYVKELMNDRDDGFAVELVVFDDYMCGNPDYFEKPSRRNGQCKLNGRVLEPVYRDELYRGYKQRKTDKNIKFLSYLVKADSVPFSDRIYGYKLDRFKSEYFEITLGRVPRDMGGFWNHNLVYIQDNQVCHIDYFTNYCGELYAEYMPIDPPAFDTTGAGFAFIPERKRLDFDVPFEKNKSAFTESDISEMIRALESNRYRVDSINIQAYASPEGSVAQNARLHRERAKSITEVLQARQMNQIQTSVSSTIDWDSFYKSISASKRWKHLATLDKEELQTKLNNGYSDSLEYFLAKCRKADIALHCMLPPSENLSYYIRKEYEESIAAIKNGEPYEGQSYTSQHHRLRELRRFAHRALVEGLIDTALVIEMRPATNAEGDPMCSEDLALYQFYFPKVYGVDPFWSESKEGLLECVQNDPNSPPSSEFSLCYVRERSIAMNTQEEVSREDVQALLDKLEELKHIYVSDSLKRRQIERINFNLNMILVNKVFASDPKANEADAYESVNELYDFYLKSGQLTDAVNIKLAKMAVYYGDMVLAQALLRPHRASDTIRSYLLPLEYQHTSTAGSETFYRSVIRASDEMDPTIWCNMFFAECGIPFQAFDHNELRDVFCEKCLEENAFVKELIDP